MVRDRRGLTRLGCLVWLLITAVVLYLAVQFGEPWFRYQQYRDEMKIATSFGETLSDSEIRARVQARADSLDLPPDARKINITRSNNRITVSTRYQVIVQIPWYGPVTLTFAPRFEGPL